MNCGFRSLPIVPARAVWLLAISCSVAVGCSSQTAQPQGPPQPKRRALPLKITQVLDQADVLIVYSIEPGEVRDADPASDKYFQNYPVLGKIEPKDELRKEVLAALYQGISDSDGVSAQCFDPGFGIHARRGQETVDLVICYSCMYILVFKNGERSDGVTTDPSPARTFMRLFKQVP